MQIYVLKISSMMREFKKEELVQMLPDFRKGYQEKYRNPGDYDRSLAAGVLLGYCMNQKGVSRKETPSFQKNGKMYFPQVDRFYVNLSHSGDYVACGVDTQDIGIDMECIRPYKEAVARRICTEEETALLLRGKKEDEKDCIFTMLWTQKESVTKLLGEGIGMLFQWEELQKQFVKEGILTRTYTTIPDYYISVSSRNEEFAKDIIVLSPECLKQWHLQFH